MHFVQKLLLSLAQIYKVFVKFLIKAEHKKLFLDYVSNRIMLNIVGLLQKYTILFVRIK